MRKDYAHEITVDLPVSEALTLFTPRGEEAWVPGWKPFYIWPRTGKICEEMIFKTGEGLEETIWTCLAWRPDQGHVRYHRLTPGSRLAFVDVHCRSEGGERTRVRVTYEIFALSNHGRAYLEELSDSAFAAMINGWSELIRELGLERSCDRLNQFIISIGSR